jgi:hypothetical protein
MKTQKEITKKELIELIKKSDSRSDFKKKNPTLYRKLIGSKLLSEVLSLIPKKKPDTLKWDFEACKKEASDYESRDQFRLGSPGAYDSANDRGWLDEICSHMLKLIESRNHWNKANVLKEAKNYKTMTEFRKAKSGAVDAASVNKWLPEVHKVIDRLNKDK